MNWNLSDAIQYYNSQGAPGNQQALIALLKEIQQEWGGIPPYALEEIARAYGIRESVLNAVIKRIPALRLLGSHCLELCAGANCGKHTALAALAESMQKAAPGKFYLKFVPCMRQCGKGPNLRFDGTLYHQADEALLRRLLK